jgi:hypothetical protein
VSLLLYVVRGSVALTDSHYLAKSLTSKTLSGYYLGCAMSDPIRDAVRDLLAGEEERPQGAAKPVNIWKVSWYPAAAIYWSWEIAYRELSELLYYAAATIIEYV